MAEEIGVLNRFSCPDAYSLAGTIVATGAKRLTIFVYNNSILYQLALDERGGQWQGLESELPPGFHSFARECSGIRFRNLVAGSVGIVSIKMLR